MSVQKYISWNSAMPTSSGLVKVSTGTSIKTMLQIATPSTRMFTIVSWGYTLDAVPATSGQVELLETDVAATVTAHVAAGVQPLMPGVPASLATLSTSGTGYSASAEGTIAASRVFDNAQIPTTAGATDIQYDYEFMPDARPVVNVSKFLRVRVTFGAAVNMSCYVVWEE